MLYNNFIKDIRNIKKQERKKRKVDDSCLIDDEENISKDDVMPRVEKEVDNKASVLLSSNIVKQKLIQPQIKLDMSKMSVKQLAQQVRCFESPIN